MGDEVGRVDLRGGWICLGGVRSFTGGPDWGGGGVGG
jgi:hypothetical protein